MLGGMYGRKPGNGRIVFMGRQYPRGSCHSHKVLEIRESVKNYFSVVNASQRMVMGLLPFAVRLPAPSMATSRFELLLIPLPIEQPSSLAHVATAIRTAMKPMAAVQRTPING